MKKIIGHKLINALTADEMAQLLDAAFTQMNPQDIQTLLSKLDSGIAGTVSQLVFPEKSTTKRIVSDNKYVEEWNALWDEWEDIVAEVGDEHGKYVYQENDWDPPEFESFAFTEDLDRIAGKMLPLIEKIAELGVSDDMLFEQALTDIESNIKSYPESMEVEQYECPLNPKFTTKSFYKMITY